jgi:hypothetical protein
LITGPPPPPPPPPEEQVELDELELGELEFIALFPTAIDPDDVGRENRLTAGSATDELMRPALL